MSVSTVVPLPGKGLTEAMDSTVNWKKTFDTNVLRLDV